MNPNKENTQTESTGFQPSSLTGHLKQAEGIVEKAAGKVVGDDELVTEGATDSLLGKVEVKAAELKEKAKSVLEVAGDAMERVGEKLAEKGFEKAGAALREVGDKIEHTLQ